MTTAGKRLLRALEASVFVCAIAGGVLFGRTMVDTGDAAGTTASPARATVAVASPAAVDAVRTRALALVGARTPAGWRVRFVVAHAGDPRGTADRDRHAITVFVRAGDPPHRVAHDLAHELGHAWDATHMSTERRRAYLERRGHPGAGWFPARAGADYATGAGDFAEVFARCRAASPEFRSTLAPAPADACALLPAAARR